MNESLNLVNALKYSKKFEAKVQGIVVRDEGFTKQIGDSVVVVPVVNAEMVTPQLRLFTLRFGTVLSLIQIYRSKILSGRLWN